MSSDSGELLKSITPESFSGEGNFFENLGNDYLNYQSQMLTGGLVGFKDGKLGNGAYTNYVKMVGKTAVNGLKEVTGAKAAEEANAQARAQFEQSKIDAETARVEAQNQVGLDQMRQSKNASAGRSRSTSSYNKGPSIGNTYLGSDEKDFLGL